MQRTPGTHEAVATLELVVGTERIEVRIDAEGLHFRHPHGTAAEGHLCWEVALAQAMLPLEFRRTAA